MELLAFNSCSLEPFGMGSRSAWSCRSAWSLSEPGVLGDPGPWSSQSLEFPEPGVFGTWGSRGLELPGPGVLGVERALVTYLMPPESVKPGILRSPNTLERSWLSEWAGSRSVRSDRRTPGVTEGPGAAGVAQGPGVAGASRTAGVIRGSGVARAVGVTGAAELAGVARVVESPE
jgi:hypothetical protein